MACWWLDSAVTVIVLCVSALVEVRMGRLLKWPRAKQLAFDSLWPYHFSDLLLYAMHRCRSYATLGQPNSIENFEITWGSNKNCRRYYFHGKWFCSVFNHHIEGNSHLFRECFGTSRHLRGHLRPLPWCCDTPPSEECCGSTTIPWGQLDLFVFWSFVGIPVEQPPFVICFSMFSRFPAKHLHVWGSLPTRELLKLLLRLMFFF